MEYIKSYPTSLPPDLCERIIEKYEKEDTKQPGVTKGGVNTDIKHTMDFHLKFAPEDEEWKEIDTILYNELHNRMNEYYDELNTPQDIYVRYVNITDYGFQIQRYEANEGFYKYHNDFNIEEDERPVSFRLLTYLWYLNTVDEGGETEFFGNYKIKPEQGKLVLFPATWTYPHKGCMPLSGRKYIITGWIYGTM
jgi:hypothetical protein